MKERKVCDVCITCAYFDCDTENECLGEEEPCHEYIMHRKFKQTELVGNTEQLKSTNNK